MDALSAVWKGAMWVAQTDEHSVGRWAASMDALSAVQMDER